ncbi:uncharacterized protein ACB058_010104 [Synchiropus picturatus]
MTDLFITSVEVSDDEILLHGDPFDGDVFKYSGISSYRFILNKEGKYLALEANGENLCGKNLNVRETEQLDCRFFIQIYDSTKFNPKAIMLCINTKNGLRCLCTDGYNLRIMEQPSSPLLEDSHEAIFFLEKLSGNRYRLESSKHRSCFICFEPVRQGVAKAVLRYVEKNNVDESCQISFQPSKPSM